MNDKNLCYSCARGKVCRENPAFPCKECSCYVAEQKWISVKDRLPEPFVTVLVHMPQETPLPTVHAGYISKDGVWVGGMFKREADEVTHWMPLPEPPATVSTKSE